MRPLRLTLQAFGPFAEKVVIDFSAALELKLFGIYGPTGAGKTSIFDGISFALFGESSGNERSASSMRSDHASLDIRTEVELVFDLGEKRYVISRIPDQTKLNKSGKEVKQTHEANLFDATGIPLEKLTEDNKGAVIAEKKVSSVAEELKNILGYTSSQFRQIVLLPQGEFRKILDASSEERFKILKELFDVSVYEAFIEKLQKRTFRLREEIQNLNSNKDGIFLQVECNSEAELLTEIETKKKNVQLINEKLSVKKNEFKTAETNFNQGKVLINDFEKLEKCRTQEIELNKETSNIMELKLLLVKLNLASTLAVHEKNYNDANENQKNADVNLKQAIIDLNLMKAIDEDNKKLLFSQQNNKPVLDKTNLQILKLKSFVEKLNEVEKLKVPLEVAAQKLNTVESTIFKTEEDIKQAAAKLSKFELKLIASEENSKQIREVGLEVDEFERKQKEIFRYDQMLLLKNQIEEIAKKDDLALRVAIDNEANVRCSPIMRQ